MSFFGIPEKLIFILTNSKKVFAGMISARAFFLNLFAVGRLLFYNVK